MRFQQSNKYNDTWSFWNQPLKWVIFKRKMYGRVKSIQLTLFKGVFEGLELKQVMRHRFFDGLELLEVDGCFENFFLGLILIVLFLRGVESDDLFDGFMLLEHFLMVTSALKSIFGADIFRHQCMWSFSSLCLLIFQEDMSIFYQETHVLAMFTVDPVGNLEVSTFFRLLWCLFGHLCLKCFLLVNPLLRARWGLFLIESGIFDVNEYVHLSFLLLFDFLLIIRWTETLE